MVENIDSEFKEKLKELLHSYKEINENETEQILGKIKKISSEYTKDRDFLKYQTKLNIIKNYLELELLIQNLPKFKKSKKRSKLLRKTSRKTSRKSPTKPRRKSNQKL